MNTALNKQPGHLKTLRPAINEPPSAAARQVQQIPHQIKKDLKDIEENLETLKEHKEPWDEENLQILENLFQKFHQYKREGDVVPMIGDLLVKHNFFDVVVKIWDHCHSTENLNDSFLISQPYIVMKRICWNFSDKCVNFCKEAFRHKLVFERFMREFTLPELRVEKLNDKKKFYLIEATLGFLHNTVRLYNPNREHFRQNDGIQRLLSYCNSEHLLIKTLVMLVLAYCINEEEDDKIVIGTGVIAFITDHLKSALENPNHVSKSYRFSASEIVCGLNKLALNDRNKVSILKSGVLPYLTDMMTNTEFPDEQALAAECLWSLSFISENKEGILTEPGLMDAVRRLFSDHKSDEDIHKLCEGILFNMEVVMVNHAPPFSSVARGTRNQHIMISYQWNDQPIALKLRDKLKDIGLNVWLDVDNMTGSILDAMADAVENASVLVVGVTERYKNSNSCRTEAAYANSLKKPIVPLLLEPHYKADGWLSALLGMELYVDVSSKGDLDAKFDDIVKMIRLKAGDQIFKTEIGVPDRTDTLPSEQLEPDENIDAAQVQQISKQIVEELTVVDKPGLMDTIRRLIDDPESDEVTRKSCEGILLISEGKNIIESPLLGPVDTSATKQHIMISYQHDVQSIILKLRDKLKQRGLKIWLDVDNMKGRMASAMAKAVENASVVVMCVSEKYQTSYWCSKEADYANQLSKPIAPLLLQPGYKADDWLGLMLGTELYISVGSEDDLDVKFDGILEMIKTKAGDQIIESEIMGKAAALSLVPSDSMVDGAISSKSFSKWSTNDVSKWAEETGIDGLPSLFDSFDGVALEQLIQLLGESPEIYYNFLRNDLKLSMLQSLRFTHFVKELRCAGHFRT